MAWTAPRTWVADEIVTAALLNAQIRDNALVLSTHAHTGAAGMGASTLSAVTLTSLATATFADQSGNPSTNGRLQRNGTELLYYDGTTAQNLTAADAAAGTGSLRSLGTGATQAAAGNHTHAQTAVTLVSEVTGTVVTPDEWNAGESDEKTFANIAVDTASASNALSLNWQPWAVQSFGTDYGFTMTVTIKIYYNSVLVQTITGLSTANSLTSHGTIKAYARMPASDASHNFYFTMQPTSTLTGTIIVHGYVAYNVNELQASI